MKKLLLITIGIFLLVGCTSEDLNRGYEKMKSNDINGYNLDLRIYGTYNNEKINETVKIDNYNNEDYKITVNTNEDVRIIDDNTILGDTQANSKVLYIKDGKVYEQDNTGYYILNTGEKNYTNPSIYLEGLRNIKKSNRSVKEKIGNKDYKRYDIVIDMNIAKRIVEDTVLTDIKIDKDIPAKVYLDSNNNVYRIIYYIDDVTINANYFGINTSTPINFPSEIK